MPKETLRAQNEKLIRENESLKKDIKDYAASIRSP